ncbi:hypothetical protein [Microcoleus sp. CAWBG556]|uniref:hypothetical protein n=1 Tax=Microcoleus sp. CAWBG556 TaxID=2841650 RepID=UPI0025E1ED40|nr:hypothetical protein [Microcoleus sp. CAWBG556]
MSSSCVSHVGELGNSVSEFTCAKSLVGRSIARHTLTQYNRDKKVRSAKPCQQKILRLVRSSQ